ncbi:export-related chaperone CsaA [Pseudopedobacter saltans DSM 12145]|uniref:Export-related chaperone CsaA n=1 Tax=Pseudopedobacter saltans (strain ATCC 51119 / DSM 12145 / JCM 21818 / CCUG 39354 / LMG 10337 / NBRC 100064 / NCIMB 13643) TaxID=762903 RepID=F0SEZ7_PSESL|nr:tRNA-binding protein [Pseudopedobacter saltans]ADY54065.1 export-related chaperone CsaA [Pseudopedobacter saltans DSM 12145]
MDVINWADFEKVDLRAGTIIEVLDFPEAKKPAYKVRVDFGEQLGVKTTSAQITAKYNKEELLGKQIVGVVNFPKKQIGKFMSEFLLTGFHDEEGNVCITVVDKKVPDGAKLC